jgi:hypothetical protein
LYNSIYKVGDQLYLNGDGRAFIKEDHEDLERYMDGKVYIVGVCDSYSTATTIYECYFVGDRDQDIIEVSHNELSLVSWVEPEPSISIEEDVIVTDAEDSYFETRGRELGALVDRKQLAYGNAVAQGHKVMDVLLEPYKIGDNYVIPQELLLHLLLLTRMIDKINRIVNNPKQDQMEENTYNDLAGYSLLGSQMTSR